MTATRLKVVVISLAEDTWGSEVSVLEMAPWLGDNGVDVSVAAPHGHFADRVIAAEIPFVPLLIPPHGAIVGEVPNQLSSVLNVAREAPRVWSGVRAVSRASAGADVVHSNSLLANVDCVLAGRLH